MLLAQPTNGSSARIRVRARCQAEGTASPAALVERPTRSFGGSGGAAVVTVEDSRS